MGNRFLASWIFFHNPWQVFLCLNQKTSISISPCFLTGEQSFVSPTKSCIHMSCQDLHFVLYWCWVRLPSCPCLVVLTWFPCFFFDYGVHRFWLHRTVQWLVGLISSKDKHPWPTSMFQMHTEGLWFASKTLASPIKVESSFSQTTPPTTTES